MKKFEKTLSVLNTKNRQLFWDNLPEDLKEIAVPEKVTVRCRIPFQWVRGYSFPVPGGGNVSINFANYTHIGDNCYPETVEEAVEKIRLFIKEAETNDAAFKKALELS